MREIVREAVKVRERAHAPDSSYYVGAAVLAPKGLYTAANVELSPSSISLHAEQRAVAKALEDGAATVHECAIAVPNDQPPCGLCLQALATAAAQRDVQIHVRDVSTDETESHLLSDLLPEAYV